jgi:hypothetical protein
MFPTALLQLIPPCPADDIPRMRGNSVTVPYAKTITTSDVDHDDDLNQYSSKVAGRIAREVLDEAVRLVRPGNQPTHDLCYNTP